MFFLLLDYFKIAGIRISTEHQLGFRNGSDDQTNGWTIRLEEFLKMHLQLKRQRTFFWSFQNRSYSRISIERQPGALFARSARLLKYVHSLKSKVSSTFNKRLCIDEIANERISNKEESNKGKGTWRGRRRWFPNH